MNGARGNSGAALENSSAMVRAESSDLDATLHALVGRLRSVPGLGLAVGYRHGRLRRLIGDIPYVNDLHRSSDPIERIEVSTDAHSYWLNCEQGAIGCGRERVGGEPGAPPEQLTFSAWASALFDELDRRNLINHQSLVALRDLIERDRLD